MSLINEVLEDLDSRDAATEPSPTRRISAVASPGSAGPERDWPRIAAWLLVGVGLLAFAAAEFMTESPQKPEFLPVAVTPPPQQRPHSQSQAQVQPQSDSTSARLVSEEELAARAAAAAAAEQAAEPESAVTGQPTERKADSIVGNASEELDTVAAERGYQAALDAEAELSEMPPAPVNQVVTAAEPAPGTLALARYRLSQGRIAEAEVELRGLLDASSSARQARELLAGVLTRGGRDAEALELLESSIAQFPDHLPFRLLGAHLYARQQDAAGAIALLEAAGSHSGQSLQMLAALYQQDGRHQQAADTYRALLEQAPANGRYHAGLGMALEATGQVAQAVTAYRRALAAGGLGRVVRDYLQIRLRALVPAS